MKGHQTLIPSGCNLHQAEGEGGGGGSLGGSLVTSAVSNTELDSYQSAQFLQVRNEQKYSIAKV